MLTFFLLNSTDPLSKFHGIDEIKILAKQIFPSVATTQIVEQWKDFRYELLEIRSKYLALKRNIIGNDMKFKKTYCEWVIEHLLKTRQYNEDFAFIIKLTNIAAVTHALINISLNGLL